MCCRAIVCAVGVVCLLVSPVWAQPGKESVEQLRQLIQELESKLQSLETGQQENRRVTQIGGARRRERDPDVMIVRLYDLSDLFAVAPAYPAQHASDLSSAPRNLFPSGSAQATGINPFMMGGGLGGGMGGMGGAAGGFGGGGFFDVKDRNANPSQNSRLPAPPQRVLHQVGPGNLGAAQTSIDDLIEAITSTIAPDTWEEVGGLGSIATLGTRC